MYYIIINPSSKSGRGMQIWKDLELIFINRKIPYQVMISTHAGHVKELTCKIIENNPEKILNLILLGGDGTVNEALQGITDFSKVRIGYIPTGSGNDLARAMKLSKKPSEILEQILNGNASHLVDLGTITYVNQYNIKSSASAAKDSALKEMPASSQTMQQHFVISSGIGFDAAVCEEALSSPIKNLFNKLKLGKLTYLIIALKQILGAKAVACDISLDNKPALHFKRFLFTASMIHPYEGGGFKFCPKADETDGFLDICLVGSLPKAVILLALPTAFFGKHYLFPQIFSYRTSKIEIKTSSPLWVHTDGEVSAKSDHITISCEQKKVLFLA